MAESLPRLPVYDGARDSDGDEPSRSASRCSDGGDASAPVLSTATATPGSGTRPAAADPHYQPTIEHSPPTATSGGGSFAQVVPGRLLVGGARNVRSVAGDASVALLCVAEDVSPDAFEDLGCATLCHLPMPDTAAASLEQQLPLVFAFVDEQCAAGRAVAIFCREGRSRSVACAMGVLMRDHPEWDFDAALKAIRRSRRQAEPNLGFVLQLKDLHARGFFRRHAASAPHRVAGAAVAAAISANAGGVDHLRPHSPWRHQPHHHTNHWGSVVSSPGLSCGVTPDAFALHTPPLGSFGGSLRCRADSEAPAADGSGLVMGADASLGCSRRDSGVGTHRGARRGDGTRTANESPETVALLPASSHQCGNGNGNGSTTGSGNASGLPLVELCSPGGFDGGASLSAASSGTGYMQHQRYDAASGPLGGFERAQRDCTTPSPSQQRARARKRAPWQTNAPWAGTSLADSRGSSVASSGRGRHSAAPDDAAGRSPGLPPTGA